MRCAYTATRARNYRAQHTAIYCIDFSTSKCQLLCFKMAAAAHFRCSYLAIAVACLPGIRSTVASRCRARGARSAAHPDLHACQPASTTLQSNENPYKLHVPSNMSSNFISHFYLSAAPMILLQIFSLSLCNQIL